MTTLAQLQNAISNKYSSLISEGKLNQSGTIRFAAQGRQIKFHGAMKGAHRPSGANVALWSDETQSFIKHEGCTQQVFDTCMAKVTEYANR